MSLTLHCRRLKVALSQALWTSILRGTKAQIRRNQRFCAMSKQPRSLRSTKRM
ncbi:hypothetical protein U9M48_031176 [Paspalum notatum var. saurae]|uniref:Uncharacterized protein n=1 Tax=Paspalum notatum var. saurae TaxID=547442 RepID=A0AAQ3X4H0_PASNO